MIIARTVFTLLVALTLVSHAGAQSPAQEQDADTQAILNHRLTIDLVKKTIAVNRDTAALFETDADFRKRAADSDAEGIDASVKKMQGIPQLAALLKKHGLSARDYLLTQMGIMSTSSTYDLMAKGMLKELPPGFPSHNLDFWKANYAQLKPLEAEWKQSMADLEKRSGK